LDIKSQVWALSELNIKKKINIAVEYLTQSLQMDPKTTRIQLINIDSRITQQSIAEVQYYINNNAPILLQSAVFFSNFQDL
jgi:hypothetical protein